MESPQTRTLTTPTPIPTATATATVDDMSEKHIKLDCKPFLPLVDNNDNNNYNSEMTKIKRESPVSTNSAHPYPHQHQHQHSTGYSEHPISPLSPPLKEISPESAPVAIPVPKKQGQSIKKEESSTKAKTLPSGGGSGSGRFPSKTERGEKQCTNCGEVDTPQWRGTLCNACALWKRSRGTDRPLPLLFPIRRKRSPSIDDDELLSDGDDEDDRDVLTEEGEGGREGIWRHHGFVPIPPQENIEQDIKPNVDVDLGQSLRGETPYRSIRYSTYPDLHPRNNVDRQHEYGNVKAGPRAPPAPGNGARCMQCGQMSFSATSGGEMANLCTLCKEAGWRRVQLQQEQSGKRRRGRFSPNSNSQSKPTSLYKHSPHIQQRPQGNVYGMPIPFQQQQQRIAAIMSQARHSHSHPHTQAKHVHEHEDDDPADIDIEGQERGRKRRAIAYTQEHRDTQFENKNVPYSLPIPETPSTHTYEGRASPPSLPPPIINEEKKFWQRTNDTIAIRRRSGTLNDFHPISIRNSDTTSPSVLQLQVHSRKRKIPLSPPPPPPPPSVLHRTLQNSVKYTYMDKQKEEFLARAGWLYDDWTRLEKVLEDHH